MITEADLDRAARRVADLRAAVRRPVRRSAPERAALAAKLEQAEREANALAKRAFEERWGTTAAEKED